ncbi:MAG: methylmalonyl-CoA mutase family protein, partial [candidate division NC10 bacterium]
MSDKREEKRFESLSGIPVKPLYTPEDLEGTSYAQRLGHPGEYPFTRGVYPT